MLRLICYFLDSGAPCSAWFDWGMTATARHVPRSFPSNTLTSALLLAFTTETDLCEGQETVRAVLPDGTLEAPQLASKWAGLLRGLQVFGSREYLPPPVDSTWEVSSQLSHTDAQSPPVIVHTPAGCPVRND